MNGAKRCRCQEGAPTRASEVKWVADEAQTLTGASLMLRDFAEWLLELELDGWQLVDPVDGGHGLMVNEDPEKRAYERR